MHVQMPCGRKAHLLVRVTVFLGCPSIYLDVVVVTALSQEGLEAFSSNLPKFGL